MTPTTPISKSTKRGMLIFFVVLVIIFILPDVIVSMTTSPKASILLTDNKIAATVKLVKRNFDTSKNRSFEKESRYLAPLEAFDPNTYTLEDWMALGLSEKQAAVIIKFGRRGIRSNEDLKRIFVISDELFALIKDSARYAPIESKYPEKQSYSGITPKLTKRVEINTATEEELMTVKGIGSFFAKQIIKKRNELGGFLTIQQLLEVWKMDEVKIQLIEPSITINSVLIRKINLNTTTAEELKSHPYISWNLANSIVKLRTQFGRFKSVEEVKKSVLMTDEVYDKLVNYLSVE